MLRSTKPLKITKFLYLVNSILITMCTLFVESKMQKFIDSNNFSIYLFIILLSSFLLLAVLRYLKVYTKTKLDKEGTLEGQAQIVHLAFRKYYNDFYEKDIGGLLYNLTEDVYKLMPWYTYGKLELTMDIIYVVCIFLMMLAIDSTLSIITVLCIFISLGCANILSNKLAKVKNEQQKLNGELNQQMISSGMGIHTIRQLRKENLFEGIFNQFIDQKYLPVLKKTISCQAIFVSQMIFSREIIPFVILFIGILFSLVGRTTIGSAIVIMDMSIKMSDSIQAFGDNISQWHLSREIENRMKELFDAGLNTTQVSTSITGDFECLQVKIDQFRYHQDGAPVLEDINFEVRRGEILLLKGESGNGKSTLGKLMAGILALEERAGKVYYNQTDINRLDMHEYHNHVLMVCQDVILFYGTLLENIVMEQTFCTADIDEVIWVCGLEEFVKERGLNYVISQSGDNVSGGQKQRIGIARILIRKPNVLILDEITSALDSQIAKIIVERIIGYAKKYSIALISISHGNEFDRYYDKTITLSANGRKDTVA